MPMAPKTTQTLPNISQAKRFGVNLVSIDTAIY